MLTSLKNAFLYPLLRSLEHEDIGVRRCAAAALGKIGNEAARAPLARIARCDPGNWRIRETGQVVFFARRAAEKALRRMDRSLP